ncbi:MAG: hypothetical protein JWP01_2595 [Myxococcales bacterium]|nr:hypothetical protein [Myxococcales bacterium]
MLPPRDYRQEATVRWDMSRIVKTSSTLVLVLAAACSNSGTSAQAAPELAAAAGPYAAEFPGFDATAIAKKLQGTWVFKGSMDQPTVWSIEGTKVTQVEADGKTKSGTLEISSPCIVTMRMADDGGQPFSYTFAGDTLHLGMGDAGAIVGKTTYACAYPSLFRTTGDTCEIQAGNQSKRGKLSYLWEKTECTVDATSFSGKDQFDRTAKLQIAGTALYDEQLKTSVATKVADLAAGKAKQAELATK